MTIYRRGSTGDGVRTIEQALAALGLYAGAIDGVFGSGTEAAVRAFQAQKGLEADGIVGPATWAALVPPQPEPPQQPESPPQPEASSQSLADDLAARCLALVGSFETGRPVPDCFAGLSGNFDGQGMSFGAMQWCLGQGSLQPLLKTMDGRHADIIDRIFGAGAAELRAMLAMTDTAGQVAWAAQRQTPKFRFNEPWEGCFSALGRTPEYQAIQVDAARTLFQRGLDYCRTFGLKSQRAAALMFDIRVQNGSISAAVQAQILDDFRSIPPDDEVARMKAVAERRSAVCNPRWVDDVRSRMMMIAEGGGVVHGASYDLAGQYGITMDPVPGL